MDRAIPTRTDPIADPLPLVLVVGDWLAPYLDALRSRLTVAADIRLIAADRDAQVAEAIADADIVVASSLSEVLARSALRLRFLQVPGSGVDRIAIASLPGDVIIANCFEHEDGIAEYVIMQCLALQCSLLALDRTLRRQDWSLSIQGGARPRPELGGRTLGVLGFGRVGREVARLARAFHMRVVAMTAHPPPAGEWETLGVSAVHGPDGLLDVIGASDFVVVCMPLDDDTRGMISHAELIAMKPTAFLINPSRGPIVEEAALYAALRDRTIAGAAIDTWYRYPEVPEQRLAPSAFPFEELENVIMTPHIAGYTADTMARRMTVVAANISSFLMGGPIVHRVPRPGQD